MADYKKLEKLLWPELLFLGMVQVLGSRNQARMKGTPTQHLGGCYGLDDLYLEHMKIVSI
mgnify:CR=1 FL=1